jgi:hypothetical protein
VLIALIIPIQEHTDASISSQKTEVMKKKNLSYLTLRIMLAVKSQS